MVEPYFVTNDRKFVLYHGDARSIVSSLGSAKFDMIFADPPYFLSNGGFSVHSGARVSVDKGSWDKSNGLALDMKFNYEWIRVCRDKMRDDATIWICGTIHNIFSVATVLSELDFRILNAITWQKTNPPPNLSCRMFTHSTEFLIWARKTKRTPHVYNYDLMHKLAGNRQMTDVWRMPSIARWEKSCGKHPTQKPLALVVRAILACTQKNAKVLDPFTGSSTTGIAANLLGRSFVGMDIERKFLDVSVRRRHEFDKVADIWARKIPDLNFVMV